MENRILKLFIEKGFLLDREVLNFFNELEDIDLAKEIVNKLSISSNKKIITKAILNDNLQKLKPFFNELGDDKKKLVESFLVNFTVSFEIKREVYEESINQNLNNVKVLSSPVIASQKLEARDFIKHFRNRYNFFKKILQERKELDGLTSIDKITGNKSFSIIAIVNKKNITKNKNIILEVEDLTGTTRLLINRNNEDVFEKSKEILLDDVIGFKCSGTRDFVYVNDLFFPEAFLRERKKADREVYALFTSDIHVGSLNFLEKNFEKFISWLNGNCSQEHKKLINKIGYIFLTGDSIDGVGIFPGQEKFLKIKDIKEQYKKLAYYLSKIPKHIKIIQCPGQHDAVRVAEPQPPIGDDFAEPLHSINNLILVSNPSLIEIEGGINKQGIKVLMYHGASMHGVVNEIEELRLNNGHHTPAKIVKHLLKRRHLAPSHGDVIYIPNKEKDGLIINEIPDIVTTGDLHKPDIDKFNNILIISNSCWQSITPFEEKVGNEPEPCKVNLLNLKTGEIKVLDFSDDEIDEEKCEEEKEEIICK